MLLGRSRPDGGPKGATGEFKRFEDLHDLAVRLLYDPSGLRSPLGGWNSASGASWGIAKAVR
jgi:hypothetical protein